MGNEKVSTKNQILKILRTSMKKHPGKAVSGEELAEMTGISRVSVWKAVQALISSGYEIESVKTGYFLKSERKDSVLPFEFGENEGQIIFLEETASTMDEARKIVFERMLSEDSDALYRNNNGDKNPVIVTCDKQTCGKDRKGERWLCKDGSLAFTLVTKVSVPSSK